MWVKQLIGRLAGTIVNLPFSAAENVVANGTGVLATNDEVIAAGLAVEPIVPVVRTDILPLGYRAEPTEVGGYDLFDAAGALINVLPLPNLIAAVETAHDHRQATVMPIAVFPMSEMPPIPTLTKITSADYTFDPIEGGFNVFDPAGVRISDGAVVDEASVRLLVLAHIAETTGRTTDQIEADERDLPPIIEITVPENWRDLHWSQRKVIATQINNGVPPVNAADAVNLIEEYLTRP